jgi:tetratricopeptide (TPR) repeat protein
MTASFGRGGLRAVVLFFMVLQAGLWVYGGCSVLARQDALASTGTLRPSADEKRQFIQGSFLSMKGDYWGAIDLFRKLKNTRPSDAAVHYALSKAYLSLSVLDSARVYGENAVRIDPSNRHYLTYLAEIAHDMQDFERAAQLYGQAAVLTPGSSENLNYQALEFLAAGNPEKSLSVFKDIVRLDPLNSVILSQVLLLEIRLKRYEDAIVTTGKLLDLEDADKQRLSLTLGELYVKTGQDDLAVRTYRDMLSAEPGFIPAWLALFEISIEKGKQQDYERDLQLFYGSKALNQDNAHDMARLFLIRAEKDTAYAAPAALMLEDLVARYPRSSPMYILKGQYQVRTGKPVDAVSSYQKAIALEPRNIYAWEELVTTFLLQKQYRKVFDAIRRAKSILPQHTERLRVLEGYALFQTGAVRKAAAVLEKVTRSATRTDRNSLLIQANTTLALAYDKMGRRAMSIRVYERLLALDPHNTLAMNNLAYMLADQPASLSRALQLAVNAVSLEPDNGIYLDTLGWIYFKLGNYQKAAEVIEKAVAAGTREAEIFRHLGMVYEKIGDHDRARSMFDKARNLPSDSNPLP